ncbi:transcriptional regulator [Actinoallomurus acaciae]|uniref:Transcriptional regulator n=1 Tax=Actinoallomurus acaciae TaxID=502577 RepID=A0ABV5Y7M9_9ACTN
MSEPNILLDALLDEAGISRAGLASRINRRTSEMGKPTQYDHTSVGRWVDKSAIPRGDTPSLICELIGHKLGRTLTLADIGMNRALPTHEDAPLRRTVDSAIALWRGDLKQSTRVSQRTNTLHGAAAIAPVFEWENPPDDIDVSHHGTAAVGMSDVDRIRDARNTYEQMYRRVGGVPVRPRIVQFLSRRAAPLLRGTFDDRTGRELYRAVGGLVALAGISAYDSDHQALAQRYFLHALRMAKASGQRSFGGYVVALLANQAMYRGNLRLVIQYAETALRGARGELSPALVSDLHTLQAKAYARIGDATSCHRHMRAAERGAARIDPASEPRETGYVQPGLIETQHADALRRLGDLKAAQDYAEEAVATASASHLRGQAHRYATLALVLSQRGEAEAAIAIGDEMLQRAEGMESARIHDRVVTVARALQTHDSTAVRAFLERVRHQAGTSL